MNGATCLALAFSIMLPDSEYMERIENLLQKHFHGNNWTITPTVEGQHKKSYLAQCAELKVFIKSGVPVVPLQRLSQLQVAPEIIGSGSIEGEPYVIQRYLAGAHPDRDWLTHRLPLLAQLIKRYHMDQQLTASLTEQTASTYEDHLQSGVEQLEKRLDALDREVLHTSRIAGALYTLQLQAQNFQAVKLVPVHPDPNTKNMLIVGDHLYLIDWDEITLSDPLRDIGLILWWYIPPQNWPEFFTAYGLQPDEASLRRIFWWCSYTSLAVAIWLAEHGHDCRPFLQDFLAALAGENNPRAIF